MCIANPDCVAYYNNVTECLETDGAGLMGALPSSPNAMTVYIDSSLNPGNVVQIKLSVLEFPHLSPDMISRKNVLFSVDCTLSAWSNWDTCSHTCGGGTHQRTRFIDGQAANGGMNCTGNTSESGVCNANPCPSKDCIEFSSLL